MGFSWTLIIFVGTYMRLNGFTKSKKNTTDRWACISLTFLSVTIRILLHRENLFKSSLLWTISTEQIHYVRYSATKLLPFQNQIATKSTGCPWEIECSNSPSIPNQMILCAGEWIYLPIWMHCTPAGKTEHHFHLSVKIIPVKFLFLRGNNTSVSWIVLVQ